MATAINAISVIPTSYAGTTILTTKVEGYEGYAALPQVVEYQGGIYCRTGWNSDTMLAYYKQGGLYAVAR